MILPSLLEYSPETLEMKLQSILAKTTEFYEITGQSHSYIHLHLDQVMRYFAQDRSVLMSLELGTVFELCERYLHQYESRFTVHLMGLTEDLIEAYKFIMRYDVPSKWRLTVYVPFKFFSNATSTLIKQNLEVGSWFDLGEYDSETEFESQSSLLMTVLAGKSGQNRLDSDKLNALSLAESYKNKHFIVDGGWKMEDVINPPNVDVVMFSSFWSKFK